MVVDEKIYEVVPIVFFCDDFERLPSCHSQVVGVLFFPSTLMPSQIGSRDRMTRRLCVCATEKLAVNDGNNKNAIFLSKNNTPWGNRKACS